MANIDIIKNIANNEQNNLENEFILPSSTNMLLQRTTAFPLDSSEIFLNLENAQKYAKGQDTGNSLQQCHTSYVGQHLKVVDENGETADTYQIQNINGDLKKLLAEPLKGHEFDFDNYTLKAVLTQVIEALGGTVKEEQSHPETEEQPSEQPSEQPEENTVQEEIQQ